MMKNAYLPKLNIFLQFEEEILAFLASVTPGGEGGYLTKFNTGKPRGPTSYPCIYHFGREGTPFKYLLLKKGTPFTYLSVAPVLCINH